MTLVANSYKKLSADHYITTVQSIDKFEFLQHVADKYINDHPEKYSKETTSYQSTSQNQNVFDMKEDETETEADKKKIIESFLK